MDNETRNFFSTQLYRNILYDFKNFKSETIDELLSDQNSLLTFVADKLGQLKVTHDYHDIMAICDNLREILPRIAQFAEGDENEKDYELELFMSNLEDLEILTTDTFENWNEIIVSNGFQKQKIEIIKTLNDLLTFIYERKEEIENVQ